MSANETPQSDQPERNRDRRFSVSANRGSARHRIRYVEAGGASVDIEECTFCQANPELDWEASTTSGRKGTPEAQPTGPSTENIKSK
ncbi:hypothetical protein MLC59_02345 [Marinobacter bryozoorum]|uniref:hypothetical protein n=1 Tax=Marinobacter bryozoorum TaxID=256324 RepID=UPI002004A4F8|nr:hypothetical protein [Marinobacter bryozoorum]MCK7543009.1 hypothetical protein [Marinobacter bryozoorum]